MTTSGAAVPAPAVGGDADGTTLDDCSCSCELTIWRYTRRHSRKWSIVSLWSRRRRIAVWFNADSDEAAEEKALEIYHNTPAKDFEAGDDERDCTLYNKDTGKMVFDWG